MTKKILQLVVVLLIATQGLMAQTVQVYDVTVDPGEITVQLDMNGYTNMGSFNLTIEFDNDLLNFSGIVDPQLTGILGNVNPDGDLIIVWTDMAGANITGKLCDLQFEYSGGFSSDLTFDTLGCEVAGTDLAVIASTYVNGSVSQTTAVGTVSMTGLTETPGTTIDMPVNMAGSGFSSVGSLTYMITYDEFQMTFAGIVEDALTGVVATASNGVLEITWTGGGTAVDLSAAHPFDIQFEYNGGDAVVGFVAGCEVSDNSLVALAVDYTDGSVAATAGTASLTIDNIGATAGDAVNIPIVAADFGSNVVGAITMVISYNSNLLEYTGYTAQQLSGWVVNSSTIGELTMEWSSLTGSTLTSDNLVTLNFNYDSVGGLATIQFEPGTFLKDVNIDIIPVSLYNGSIANLTVSGQLTYNGVVARPIFSSTVYLKKTVDSTVAYTTTTDANGDYSFTDVAVGSYFFDAATTIDGSQAYDLTDAFDIAFIGGTFVGLQALAADVNTVGGVDISDAFDVSFSYDSGNYNKVPTWLAPEWIFENPSVIVVDSNISQDFGGICSVDANASFVPVP